MYAASMLIPISVLLVGAPVRLHTSIAGFCMAGSGMHARVLIGHVCTQYTATGGLKATFTTSYVASCFHPFSFAPLRC